MSNSFEILSESLSNDRIFLINLSRIYDEKNRRDNEYKRNCFDSPDYCVSITFSFTHQLPSPAPLPGTKISTAISTILSTTWAGFTCDLKNTIYIISYRCEARSGCNDLFFSLCWSRKWKRFVHIANPSWTSATFETSHCATWWPANACGAKTPSHS